MYDWAEYRHFRYLLEILDLKGFRAAAEQLHTTQPNLSAHAKQFRENSGLHLYRRSKSGRISLTPTGVAFKLIARGLLSARDEAMAALLAVEQGEVRTLRLGCSSQADPTLFHAFFSMHRELLPNCPIRPVHGDTEQLVEEIAAGEVDAAIVTLPVGDLSLRVDEIQRDRLGLPPCRPFSRIQGRAPACRLAAAPDRSLSPATQCPGPCSAARTA